MYGYAMPFWRHFHVVVFDVHVLTANGKLQIVFWLKQFGVRI